ncbi:DUF2303 family protein [Methylobacter tundripaludum]|nr:DUF2303 family protein [Methylobacter tundripaludum]
MDKSAIEAIAGLSAAKAAQHEISQHPPITAIVIPKDYSVENLERLLPNPDQFRGTFRTAVLSEFVGYIDGNATSDTGVFIDQNKMTAAAIIDMGSHEAPNWGKHKANVALDRTPAYAALIRLHDERMNQQSFIDFAEDWQDNVSFYYGSSDQNIADFKSTIRTLRKLKTSATNTSETEVGNFAANRSAMESIEVTAGAEQPPAGFLFKTIPHDGFEKVVFDCQLRAMPDTKEVFLKYRIVQLAQHQEKIAEQFRDKIQSSITVDGISIYIGNMEYQS